MNPDNPGSASRWSATSVASDGLLVGVDLSRSLLMSVATLASEAHARSALSTSVTPVGLSSPLEIGGKEMTMTPLLCNYTIAPLKESVPTRCDRPAIRRATFEDDGLVMLYCFLHWNMVKDLGEIMRATVEDASEEMC